MQPDPWLQRWLPLLRACSGTAPVLEIGCGTGEDTAVLASAGLAVTAFDIAATSVAATRLRVPGAVVECRDVRDPFPIASGSAGAVVASLSLHYFPWAQTAALFDKVRHTLRPGGVFLCRLNSTADTHFGATGHPAIEPHFHLVDGQPKRFFDAASVDRLFAQGWTVLSRQHRTTLKYVKEKALWEIVARREGDARSPPAPSMAFHPVRADDAEALVAIRIVAMRESLERVGRFDPHRARERFLHGFDPRHTWTIRVGEERAGFFVVKPLADGLLLDHLYVLPAHQGQGVGAAVLAHVFRQADAERLDVRVGALVGSDANRFYVQHGFVPVEQGEFDNYYVRHPR